MKPTAETPVFEHLTKEDATDFFSELYYGEHHLPSEVKPIGYGWYVSAFSPISTYDFSDLTRLVVMAHDRCYRAEIKPHTFKTFKICIWKRSREGDYSTKHPTMEDNVTRIREHGATKRWL